MRVSTSGFHVISQVFIVVFETHLEEMNNKKPGLNGRRMQKKIQLM